MSCNKIIFGYLKYPPPVVFVSLSFLKTLTFSENISPFLTEGSNDDYATGDVLAMDIV